MGKKLWPGHDVNRQTDGQGEPYIPPPPPQKKYIYIYPQTLIVGVIINIGQIVF